MNLLFDTNVMLIFIRNQLVKQLIVNVYQPFGSQNEAIVSVITVGELKAISLKNIWGNTKKQKMEELLSDFVIADINSEDVLNRYAEIDAFSQCRLDNRVSNFTARNMGKNDIWIAATASVLEAILLTTDNDFNHLHDEFLAVAKIDLNI